MLWPLYLLVLLVTSPAWVDMLFDMTTDAGKDGLGFMALAQYEEQKKAVKQR